MCIRLFMSVRSCVLALLIITFYLRVRSWSGHWDAFGRAEADALHWVRRLDVATIRSVRKGWSFLWSGWCRQEFYLSRTTGGIHPTIRPVGGGLGNDKGRSCLFHAHVSWTKRGFDHWRPKASYIFQRATRRQASQWWQLLAVLRGSSQKLCSLLWFHLRRSVEADYGGSSRSQ